MNKNISAMALAVAGAMLVVGCGGGGRMTGIRGKTVHITCNRLIYN